MLALRSMASAQAFEKGLSKEGSLVGWLALTQVSKQAKEARYSGDYT